VAPKVLATEPSVSVKGAAGHTVGSHEIGTAPVSPLMEPVQDMTDDEQVRT
jgi:hypothetical protein